MCTQVVYNYQCGCQSNGEFVQCDMIYQQQTNLRCARTDRQNIVSRNYCLKHMPRVDKATS